MSQDNELSENDETLPSKTSEIRRGSDDFFEKMTLMKTQFEDSRKRTIKNFKFKKLAKNPSIDGDLNAQGADKFWPSLGASNVEELYRSMLFALTHSLKTATVRDQSETDSLISHLQSIFHFDEKKHQSLLKEAQDKTAPSKFLNLRIIEAKGLAAMDSNGFSDPFCTVYLTSSEKLMTSTKEATLNPKWMENFSILIQNEKDEILTVEVWDFDDLQENVREKMKKFKNVKSSLGFRNYLRDIASNGKEHDFLGSVQVHIQNIPLDGLDSWFPLTCPQNVKNMGSIHLMMVTSAEKNRKVAMQKYQHVLHLLVVHEIKEENIMPYFWNGEFSKRSTQVILRQLRWQNGLFSFDVDLAKWFVYTRVHCESPIDASLFPSIFSNLMNHARKGVFSDDDLCLIWFACEKFLDNAQTFFRNIHQLLLDDQDTAVRTAHNILNTLGQMSKELAKDDTLPKSSRVFRKMTPDTIFVNIQSAVIKGAEEMFMAIVGDKLNCDDTSVKVETMIQTGHLLASDLKVGLEKLDPEFKWFLKISYFGSIYLVYDQKYCELVKPFVETICSNFAPLDEAVCHVGSLVVGKTLLQLYFSVLQFSDFGSKLECSKGVGVRGSFHQWFHGSVLRWLQISFCEATKRISKAVKLDELKPSYGCTLESSSAIHVANTLHQMVLFWNQLAWPEVEDCPDFISKVLGDLCKCTTFYAEESLEKILNMSVEESKESQISMECCVAANNMELLATQLKTVSDQIELEQVLAYLAQKDGQEVADEYKKSLDTQVHNAVEKIDEKIFSVAVNIGERIQPEIQRYLLSAFEVYVCSEKGFQAAEELMEYLDTNLNQLKNKMRAKGFHYLIKIIFTNVVTELSQIIKTSVTRSKPSEVFREIHKFFKYLLEFFGHCEGTTDLTDGSESMLKNTKLDEIDNLLCLHAASTDEIILKFQKERYRQQSQVKEEGSKLKYGVITFRTLYSQHTETLQVEILSCSNLPAKDSNGLSDPFVHIGFFPQDIYKIPKRTKIIKETLFPLFDELFSIPIPLDKISMDGQLHLLVEDYNLLGRNEFIGEVFIPFQSIPIVTTPGMDNIQNFPQVQLPLTIPSSEEASKILKTLEYRQSDKIAVEFVKKQRSKQES